MKSLRGARVIVVGMAKSGVAAVELLLDKGASVVALDQKIVANPRLVELGVTVRAQDPAAIEGADLVVLSPGVPADADVAQAARARNIQVVGDLELASWFLEGETIGITGANGKTTTTAMTGHILKSSGIPVQVGGNIGTPPCSMVSTSRPHQWNVLELSSFQLETTETFRAHIGAALNVTPDHLDRHYTFENYAGAKARLFTNQTPADFAVLNADDETTRAYETRGAGTVMWFSMTKPIDHGACVAKNDAGNQILLHGKPLMLTSEVPLRGAHNIENTMAAAVMASLAGASHEQIRSAVMSFPGVDHRLQFVRDVNGVAYYNDSKATNVDATLKAIAAFDGGLWIILGGKDKGSDYTPLLAPLRDKAKGVLLIGAAAAKIESQLQAAQRQGKPLPLIQCGALDRAVAEGHAHAVKGDTVLLAPACASFDQFDSYEHRGREFKKFVDALGTRA
jgi:UDP-N-acetylmuramoylalanine--D-glutamate ligase